MERVSSSPSERSKGYREGPTSISAGFNIENEEFPRLSASNSSISEAGDRVSNPNNSNLSLDWASSLFASKTRNEDTPMVFLQPTSADGVTLSTTDFKDRVKICENFVIGFFVGRRLSFDAVRKAIPKVWKTHSEVKITIYSENAFIFEFKDSEERKRVLEQGVSFIASRMFIVRPWNPLIEQSVAEMKTIPVWTRIYNIPLHFWNNLGLSAIASWIGKPIMPDDVTHNMSRLSYARICIEVGIDCTFPSYIPLIIDGVVAMKLPVEYQWKPPKCSTCSSFGHTISNCSRKGPKTKPHWTPKKSQPSIVSEIEKIAAPGGENSEKAAMPELCMVQGPSIEIPAQQTPRVIVENIEQGLTQQDDTVPASSMENECIEVSQDADGVWTVYSKRKNKQKNQSGVPTSRLSPYSSLASVSDITLVEKFQGLPEISEDVVRDGDGDQEAKEAGENCNNSLGDSEHDSEYETDNESMGVESREAVKTKAISEITYRRPLNNSQKVDRLLEAGTRLGVPMGVRAAEVKGIFSGIVDGEIVDSQGKPKTRKELEQIKWEGVSNNANYGRGKRTPMKKS